MTIDYRELLRKYIDHVAECEGTDFILPHHRSYSPDISPDEWAALERLSWEDDHVPMTCNECGYLITLYNGYVETTDDQPTVYWHLGCYPREERAHELQRRRQAREA